MTTRTHGMTNTAEFTAWQSIRTRCLNPKAANYALYGGRGIVVCERWRDSFENFYTDMGPRPSRSHSVDREDGNGPYAPWNCRWATPKEQSRNIRTNHKLTFDGVTLTCIEWCERLGLKETTLNERLRRGWTVERALSTPTMSKADIARLATQSRESNRKQCQC